jgi:hypothetical protein
MLRLHKAGRGFDGKGRQKKPAHRERVNPSFGRVEETGMTIVARQADEKFSFAIICIHFSDISAVFSRSPNYFFLSAAGSATFYSVNVSLFALCQVVCFLLVYY